MTNITVLVDNATLIDKYYLGEPALSIYIETDGQRVLFDTGYSDILIRNAQLMSIDLSNLTHIFLSHGHIDHTGGLGPLCKFYMHNLKQSQTRVALPTIIAHPDIFAPKYNNYKRSIGTLISSESISGFFDVKLSKQPINIGNILFLGQVPEITGFEKTSHGLWTKDPMNDDTAIAIDTKEGFIIITGCSHSGICNIISYAAKLLNKKKVLAVIGGLHLMKASISLLDQIREFLKSYDIESFYPCHCTGLNAKIEISKSFNVYDVGVGLSINFGK